MIKMISLLNLIANGSGKIPAKIKWCNTIYTYNGIDYVHRYEDDDLCEVIYEHLMDHVGLTKKWLNEMVEIISYE